MIQIFGTKKCKTTRAAERFFSDRRIPVQRIDLGEKGLSKGELASVARAVGGFLALYDPTSPRVEALRLQFAAPSEARLADLLVTEPGLLKTPIVRDGARAAVGAAPEIWKTFADAARSG